MTDSGNSADRLRSFIACIERLEEETFAALFADDPMLRSESMDIVRGYWRLTPEQRRDVAEVIGAIVARRRGAKRRASRRNASRAPANNGTDRGDDAATPEARP